MTGGKDRHPPLTSRRPFLKVAAGSAVLTAIGAAARHALTPDGGGASGGSLVLATHEGSDVRSLELPLRDGFLTRRAEDRWESDRLPTSTHSMVAFTWRARDRAPDVQVRSRRQGTWTSWVSLRAMHDDVEDLPGPSGGTVGTDLLWIGRADGIQLRVRGDRPRDLTLVLLHPERRSTDRALALGPRARPSGRLLSGRTSARAVSPGVPKPPMSGRSAWGADESQRDGEPTYIHTIKQVHVHHTVSSNTYEPDDVPALLRGMYAYHTRSLGWSDIGYNFLVDRFGGCWVGRAGGAARPVRGSHTLGFNAESTGIAAIGNYDVEAPSAALLEGIAAIAAWKLHRYGRDPGAEIDVTSQGSDKYRAGRTAVLPVIDGHRDTNDTACPGGYLYAALPQVRARTGQIMAAAVPLAPITVEQPAVVTGVPELGSTLSVSPGAFQPPDAVVGYQWLRDGQAIGTGRAQSYVTRPRDVGATLSCQVTLSRTGYAPVTQTVSVPGPVTATPTLAIEVDVRRGVARVRVHAAPPRGASAVPTGTVTVRLGKRSATLPLVEGRAVARFGGNRPLRPGRYAARAIYSGDATFTAAKERRGVDIA